MWPVYGADDHYTHLVRDISSRYHLSVDEVEQRIASRCARFGGRLSRRGAARLLAAQSRLEEVLGLRHVAGLELADAVDAAMAEAAAGRLATIGYWPQPREATFRVTDQYIAGIDAIATASLDSSISVKPDRLGFDRGAVRAIFRHARLRRVRVHFDAENPRSVDQVLACVDDGLALGGDVSATLPSRWARSTADAERLLALGVPMRIVKGQGPDPDHRGIDPRQSFARLVEQVAGRGCHVAVATHDRRLAESALDRLIEARTSCSLEQLRFLPRLDRIAAARGVPVRVYVPYGRPGLPYTLNQVTRRPAILLWAIRDLSAHALRRVEEVRRR